MAVNYAKYKRQSIEDLAEKAYNAYGNYFNWFAYEDVKISQWAELQDDDRRAWIEAARAIVAELNANSIDT